MDNNSPSDDTKRAGFVSAIVMKFTKLSKNDGISFDRNTSAGRSRSGTVCNRWYSGQVNDPKNRETYKINPNVNTKFEIYGEISVKDRIKAFSELNKAVSTATKKPDVMNSSKFSRTASPSVSTIQTETSIDTKQDLDITNDETHLQVPSDHITMSQEEFRDTLIQQDENSDGIIKSEFYSFQNEEKTTEETLNEYKLSEQPNPILSASSSVSSVSELLDDYETQDQELNNDYFPLPKSYDYSYEESGNLVLKLPEPSIKSALKNGSSIKKSIKIRINPDIMGIMETYSIFEYERGDDTIDPLTASAEYEIEKKTENLEKFEVIIEKDERGLGLSIVGIGLGSDMGAEKLGIFIKGLTAYGAAEKTNLLKVHDQLLIVDGISLVGVTQKFAAQTLKSTEKVVKFVIGREKGDPAK